MDITKKNDVLRTKSKIGFLILFLFLTNQLFAVDTVTVGEATKVIAEKTAETVVATSSINALDTIWVLLGAMLVFFMQPGFALVEVGFTRSKNTTNILMKNFFDFMLGTVLFWFVGFGIMFGVGDFMGTPNFFSLDFYPETNLPREAFLVFQTVFCATSSTIVSGAMAERTKFHMYMIYTLLISAIVYPIAGHWVWGGGWLSKLSVLDYTGGFHDFAGSTIVHSLGGWLALVSAWVLGPRIGKYAKDGTSRAILGHNLLLASLGVFILWFAWFGFNTGSQLAADGAVNASAIAHVFLTTNISAAVGGLAALFISGMKHGKFSLSLTLNGVLAGLVGVTAGCDVVSPLGAATIGLVCGTVMIFSVEFIDKVLKIDDPVGASSVHGVCGFIGTIFTGLLATEDGLFYSGHWGLLAVQCIGACTIAVWALGSGFVIFKGLDKLDGLRVSKRIEEEGLDIYEHGETAYN